MKIFVALALLLPVLAMADIIGSAEIPDLWVTDKVKLQCYIRGQCQEYSLDFSLQKDAEGCHSFAGKYSEANWWSWEPAQRICLVFANCTKSGPPSGHLCPNCISGQTACPPRDCHQPNKCDGHFVDSFNKASVEECIITCNENEACNWYTLDKNNDHCILYEDCDLHDNTCDTCATGPKYCENGYHDCRYFTQETLPALILVLAIISLSVFIAFIFPMHGLHGYNTF